MADPLLMGLGALVLQPASPSATSAAVAAAISGALGAAGAQVTHADGATNPETAIEDAATRLGGLDIVVHLAAAATPIPFLERTDDAWAADLGERIGRPIRIARAAARAMGDTGGGALVFVGTLDAVHAYHGHADASVAMGALEGLVRSLAVELAPLQVRANLVLAGPLEPITDQADPALVARTLLRAPARRFVTPDEVAAAITFVAGPGAAFMTGASLRVDAGWASLNQAPDGMAFSSD